MSSDLKIPKRIFIVPYRNRVQHKFFFSKYMSFILEGSDDYEIYFPTNVTQEPLIEVVLKISASLLLRINTRNITRT